ncbi:MAG TPA: right-handed parallel beta-helix repeat-containing protein [Thermogutta sp.]|nr:right-handed parallel beta-helix repeat-containing protein [Thermogutta sp.]
MNMRMWPWVMVLTAGCLVLGFHRCLAAESTGAVSPNEQAIQEVEAGQRDTANAAWWGFYPEDSTQCLQAALRCKAKRVIIPKMASPWVVDKLELIGNKEIIFEPGVEVVAKRGAFRGKGDCLLTAVNQENLTLVGNGATLRMWRDDYAQPPYEKAEWRHCLSLRGCRNVIIDGLKLCESGGDGIYLGAGKNGEPNEKIVIRNVVCDRNYRQGISVITARDLLIENVVLSNTAGTPPEAGIDFEPNRATEVLINCVMRNCLIENNRGYAIHLYAGAMNTESQPISIRLENCRTKGTNAGSLSIVTRNRAGEAVRGFFEVSTCHFEDSENAGVIIRSKPADGFQVRLQNCEIVQLTENPKWPAPVTFVSRPGDENDVGGVVLDNLVVRENTDRPLIHFNKGGGVCLKNVVGTATIYRGADRKTVSVDEDLILQWYPCSPIRQLPIVATDRLAVWPTPSTQESLLDVPRHRLRQIGNYVFYAKKGDHVTFEMAYDQVGKNPGGRLPVRVFGPAGNTVHTSELRFQEQTRLEFTIPEMGVYRVRAEPGPNAVRLVRTSHPVAILGERGIIHLIGTTGRFYLLVPPGKSLGLEVSGDPPGECVAACLFEGTSQPLWKITGCEDAKACLVDPATVERVLCLELARPSQGVLEDEYIVIRGVPAVLSFWPDVLFVDSGEGRE